jgi:predicted permease
MLFAAGAALATVLLFGLAPAWQASDTDPGRVIKGEASQSSSGRGMVRFRATLTTVQIAFSMVLLVLAGLFTQSLMNIARVNLGIDVESLVSFSVSPRLNGYAPDEVSALYDRIEEELAAQPGVRSVASAGIPLIAHRSMGYQVSGTGFEWTPGVNNFSQSNMVSPGFFATASIPLLAGREFTVADRLGSPPVAIVNESFVRRFDLGTAVGERFSLPFVVDDIEIVGVVADAKYTEVKGDVQPQFFQPRRQATDLPALFFYVRGGIDSDAMIRMIPHLISSIDPDLPVDELTTMEAQVRDNVYIDRLTTMLSVAFAALATLLAAIGLYGVLAYNVTQRTRELGLRLALGATPGTLRGMVLKQVGVMALVGGMMGLAAAVGIGRVAEALLFGLSGYDPPVLLAAVAVLSAVVLAASYLPARRASNIAPMEALRYE